MRGGTERHRIADTAARGRKRADPAVRARENAARTKRRRAVAPPPAPTARPSVGTDAPPVVADMQTFESDARAALLHLWDGAGRERFPSRDRAALGAAIDGQRTTAASTAECLRGFNKVMDPTQPLRGCAACGVLDFEGVHHTPLAELEVLRLTADDMDDYRALSWTERRARTVVDVAGHLHALHGKFVALANGTATVCSPCRRSLVRGERPLYSVAAGYDFGMPAALGLPEPSLLEQHVLARNRTLMHIVKVAAARGGGSAARRSALNGHTITMIHDGPAKLSEALPNLDVHGEIGVIFVGPRARWSHARERLLHRGRGVLRVRAHVVFDWIDALRKVNPLYADLPPCERKAALVAELEALPEKVVAAAHLTDDAATIQVDEETSTDVARVRNGADETADVQGPFEGVFIATRPPEGQRTDAATLGSLARQLLGADTALPDGAAGGVDPTGAFAAAPAARLVVARGATPLNEFVENDDLFLGSFPHLFFLGRGIPRPSSLPARFVRHVLDQHDGRFARSEDFVFLAFNQMQRHAAARDVAARARTDPARIRRFVDLVAEKDFAARLEAAASAPETDDAKKLLRQIVPLIRLCGGNVPFGRVQRAQSVSQLYGMVQFFGLPSWFITLSPADMDSPLLLRIAGGGVDAVEFRLPEYSRRLEIAAGNPVAAARVFELLLDAVCETLFHLSSSHHRKTAHAPVAERPIGVFGTTVAHYTVIEAQGRTALHAHTMLWGGLDPDVLQRVACDHELAARAAAAIDTHVSAHISAEAHARAAARRASGEGAFRGGCTLSSLPTDDSVGYRRRYEDVAGAVQLHWRHTATCRKGTVGRIGCRLAMPQPVNAEPTGPVQLFYTEPVPAADGERDAPPARSGRSGHNPPERRIVARPVQPAPNVPGSDVAADPFGPRDPRVIVWNLRRPLEDDANLVAFCPPLSAAIGCNTATYPTCNVTVALSVLFYLVPYMTKDAVQLCNVLPLLVEAQKVEKSTGSKAEDAGIPTRTAKFLLTRTLNNIAGKIEVGAPMAAAALLGVKPCASSHDFTFVFIWPAVAAVAELMGDDADVCHGGADRAAAGTDADGAAGPAPRPFIFDEFLNEEDWDDGEAGDGAATIFRRPTDQRVIVVPQHENYQHRGPDLGQMCFLEYCAVVFVRRATLREAAAVAPDAPPATDSAPRGVGRHANTSFAFAIGHQQRQSHVQQLRSKHRVPILAGARSPRYPGRENNTTAWHAAATRWARYILCLLVPWDASSLRPPCDLSWQGFLDWSADATAAGASFVLRNRWCYAQSVACNTKVDAETKRMVTRWRTRGVIPWARMHDAPPTRPAGEGALVVEGDRNENIVEENMSAADLVDLLRGLAQTQMIPEAQEIEKADIRRRLRDIFGVAAPGGTEAEECSPARLRAGAAVGDAVCTTLTADRVREIKERLREDPHPLSVRTADGAPPAVAAAAAVPQAADRIPPGLNDNQRAAFELVFGFVDRARAHAEDPQHVPAPDPVRVLVHGGAGVGKSYFAAQLIGSTDGAIACAAPTGIAAANLPGGRTLHSLLQLSARRRNLGSIAPDEACHLLSACNLLELRERFEGVHVLLIDEISMVDCSMLVAVDRRLRQATRCHGSEFGDLAVVAMGDMFQFPPVGGVPLYKAALGCPPSVPAASRPTVLQAGALFRSFRLISFDQIMRAVADPAFAAAQLAMREPKTANRAIADFRAHVLKPLTADDVRKDESWRHATFVFPDNRSRAAANHDLLGRHALATGQAVAAWRLPFAGSSAVHLSDEMVEILYATEPELSAMFAVGAPVFLKHNVSPQRGLANGTAGTLHSLFYAADGEETAEEILARLRAARAGEVVDVPPPLCVLCEVTSAADRIGEDTLVPGRVVVPLGHPRVGTLRVKRGNKAFSVSYHEPEFELAFGVTYHKTQGKNLNRIVLNLARGCKPAVTFAAFYVGLSRVRRAAHLRYLPTARSGDLSHLDKLAPDVDLARWLRGFRSDGIWSPAHTAPAPVQKGQLSGQKRVRARAPVRFHPPTVQSASRQALTAAERPQRGQAGASAAAAAAAAPAASVPVASAVAGDAVVDASIVGLLESIAEACVSLCPAAERGRLCPAPRRRWHWVQEGVIGRLTDTVLHAVRAGLPGPLRATVFADRGGFVQTISLQDATGRGAGRALRNLVRLAVEHPGNPCAALLHQLHHYVLLALVGDETPTCGRAYIVDSLDGDLGLVFRRICELLHEQAAAAGSLSLDAWDFRAVHTGLQSLSDRGSFVSCGMHAALAAIAVVAFGEAALTRLSGAVRGLCSPSAFLGRVIGHLYNLEQPLAAELALEMGALPEDVGL